MARQSNIGKRTGNAKGGHKKTDLTPEREKLILGALRVGSHLEIAANVGGVELSTLYTWFRRGKTGEQPYKRFRDKCTMVMASLEMRVVRDIIAAGKTDPNHLKWWLERRYPERWGKRIQQEVSGDVRLRVEPVKVDESIQNRIVEVWELIPPEERSKLLNEYEIPETT